MEGNKKLAILPKILAHVPLHERKKIKSVSKYFARVSNSVKALNVTKLAVNTQEVNVSSFSTNQ